MTSTGGPGDSSLPPAKTPVGPGAQPVLGVVWAVIVIAVGVVGVRDALVYAGAISGQGWCQAAVTASDGQSAQDWMVPVGAVVAALGVLLVVVALRRRPKRGLRLTAKSGIYLSGGSIQRLAKAAASDVDGVDTTAVSASRRKVDVDATTFAPQPEQTREQIEKAVRSRLSALESPPTVRVRVRRAEGLS